MRKKLGVGLLVIVILAGVGYFVFMLKSDRTPVPTPITAATPKNLTSTHTQTTNPVAENLPAGWKEYRNEVFEIKYPADIFDKATSAEDGIELHGESKGVRSFYASYVKSESTSDITTEMQKIVGWLYELRQDDLIQERSRPDFYYYQRKGSTFTTEAVVTLKPGTRIIVVIGMKRKESAPISLDEVLKTLKIF